MARSKLEEGGANVVEVAAMLGDTVVGLKHCMDPRGGKVTRATRAFAAGGLACLLASASAFYVSIDTAARNTAALEDHTRVQNKPAYSFRPREVSAPVSWLAFGGLVLGLAVSATALTRSRAERRSPFYRIGTAPGVEQAIEGAPSESFPLVAPSGDDFVFNYGAGIEGELILDDQSTPLSELAATGRARPSATAVGAVEILIPPAGRIRARAGQTTFVVSAVGKSTKQTMPMRAMLEGRAAKYVAGSLVGHLAVLLLLSHVAVEDTGMVLDPLESGEWRPRLAMINAHEDVPPEPEEELDEGRAVDPAHPRDQSQLQVKNNQVEPRLSFEEAIEQARGSGCFCGRLQHDRIAASSNRDFEKGFDPDNVHGAFDRYVTRSITGDDYWKRRDGRPGRDHLAQVPSYSYPKEISGGTLDKSIIKRYIKRSEASIGSCYEQELRARPGLEGQVTIRFLISGGGGVQSSTGHGFDAAVASCVAGVIKSIHFPAPKDGSAVTVSYPFTFRAARL